MLRIITFKKNGAGKTYNDTIYVISRGKNRLKNQFNERSKEQV